MIFGLGLAQSADKTVRFQLLTKLQTDEGIVPSIFVPCRVNTPKFVETPSDAGTVPVKRLLCN